MTLAVERASPHLLLLSASRFLPYAVCDVVWLSPCDTTSSLPRQCVGIELLQGLYDEAVRCKQVAQRSHVLRGCQSFAA